MPTPYYQDDAVTLYHGDSLEVLPELNLTADALLTDPPYFKVKADEWDNQWAKAGDFLDWFGQWLDLTAPILAPHASAWVFASPAMTSSVERVVAERLRVLNSIRWLKVDGWHQRASLPSLRSFLTPWEGIVFAEQYPAAYPEAARAVGRELFAPFGRYLQQERQRAGLTRSELEVALGYASKADPTRGTALAYRWEEGSSLPTADTYRRAREVLNATGGDYLARDYDELVAEVRALRRPFKITDRAVSSDVWTFPTVRGYPGKHPCEKPAPLLEHMIETSTRPGDLILDPFAGSGTTLLAARELGRRAVGIEKDEPWCERVATKLAARELQLT